MNENRKKTFKINVEVDISTVLLGADESIIGIDLPDGYKLCVKNLDVYIYKNKIMTAEGRLNTKYHFARLNSCNEDSTKLLCLEKQDIVEITENSDENGRFFFTDNYFRDSQKLQDYKEAEFKKISILLWALKVFKAGDIAVNEVFMNFKWDIIEIKNKYFITEIIEDAKTLCEKTYTLNYYEIEEFNIFYSKFKNVFSILEGIILNFTYASKLLSIEKASEIYVTVLEMALLDKNQYKKKEVLSKRVATFLAEDEIELKTIYKFIRIIYKKRSESTHEGVINNVSKSEFEMLETITRRIIHRLINYILYEAQTNKKNYKAIRSELILRLKNKVIEKINAGLLPV